LEQVELLDLVLHHQIYQVIMVQMVVPQLFLQFLLLVVEVVKQVRVDLKLVNQEVQVAVHLQDHLIVE
jgi:hypothetical protein